MHKIIVALFLLVAACSQMPQRDQMALHESGVGLTDSLQGARYSNIYFSGQPSDRDWGELKKQGFAHVVNLRQSSEYDEKSEKQSLEKYGIEYTHLPMDPAVDLNPEQVGLVTKAVMAHRSKGKTLIHCGSGNRAGYWSGAHFFLDHKYSKEESVAMAEKMGMTSPQLKKKLEGFIDKTPSQKK